MGKYKCIKILQNINVLRNILMKLLNKTWTLSPVSDNSIGTE
jgi:hypothetical protein